MESVYHIPAMLEETLQGLLTDREGIYVDVTLGAGHDVKHGLIGAGVYASHGYERVHRDGIAAAYELLKAYVLSGE